jgi:hypothetical protein
MSDSDLAARAEQRLADALAGGARDPRDFYRAQMAELKAKEPGAYRRAIAYFQEELIPAVAAEGSDPLGEWLEFGRVLAELKLPGRTMMIDPDGGARPYERPVAPDALVLHLPERGGAPALIVGLPAKLSPPQRANIDLLVKQAQNL